MTADSNMLDKTKTIPCDFAPWIMDTQFIGDCTIYLADCEKYVAAMGGEFDCVVLDPPYDQWASAPVPHGCKTALAFTNHQNRSVTESRFPEKPRTEVIWHFEDGRWVSPRLPRITHANILVYGETGDAAVGEKQNKKPQKKGVASIGKDRLGERLYVPKERKHLNSVLKFPRNVSNAAGGYGKPVALIETLLMWVNCKSCLDPFMGSGTTGVACVNLGVRFVGIEVERKYFDIACERIYAADSQRRMFA